MKNRLRLQAHGDDDATEDERRCGTNGRLWRILLQKSKIERHRKSRESCVAVGVRRPDSNIVRFSFRLMSSAPKLSGSTHLFRR
jgi:hypothetical protein